MGTPARIYIKDTTERGGYHSVRVNYDGMDVGQTLADHYTTPEALAALVAEGECSSLGPTVEESIFYHRDRGEELRLRWAREDVDVSETYTYKVEDGVVYRYISNGVLAGWHRIKGAK